MALNQLPIVEASIQIVHTGPTDGASFTTTLDASDGAPAAPQQLFTFDLAVYAPDMIGTYPAVEVLSEPDGHKVEADIQVSSDTITIVFFEAVEPEDYRVKVIG